LAAVVLGLHAAGFLMVGAFGLGVGITAYTLGLRHAFDADHIAAIDNTTRKLMGEGPRPLSVGFWFSLGHSTIVLALGLVVVAGVRGLSGAVQDDGSTLHEAAGVIGPVVSGSLLLLIGVLNLAILVSLARAFRRMRAGRGVDGEQLAAGGLLTRVYGRATRAVRKPWHMYPLGVLFGLGFDTATEVALLVLAGGAAAGGLPLSAIVCLPILFAAGMSLLDTIDGAFMAFAYDWAFARPLRKIYYNMTITGLSVAVALMVGTAELVSASKLATVDLSMVGYLIAALFVLTWAVAAAVWRLGRIEERG
jgi:high-affinity nickel-transport protein